MAFTRKFLTALGIDDEKVDEIINAHADVVNGIKEERDKLKDIVEEDKDIKAKLDEAQKELDELRENGNPYEEKYKNLKTEYDEFKNNVKEKETYEHKVSEFRSLLKKAGISSKRIDTVVKASPDMIKSIDLDDNGNAKDADSIVDKLKTEWADFVIQSTTNGTNAANPPSNDGSSSMTKEQIMSIKDRSKRRDAIAKNPELFGID